jgi:peptidoglycan/LPS O-acetylase OafA/YrhL
VVSPEQSIHSSPKGFGHRRDIDGLRAVAIISVIAYHCGLRWVGGGFVGVDIFFVISGYLIGYLVYREIRENTFSITRFYSRRAKRILPALFVVLIFSYIAGMLLLSPMEMRRFAESALASITSSANIFYWRTAGYFAPHAEQNPLLMNWSLGVEEQFYLLFPPLMLLLRKASRRRLIVVLAAGGALSLVASIVSTRTTPTAAFYLLPSRAWELAAGVLLAVFESGPSAASRRLAALPAHALSLAGLACMLGAVVWFRTSTPFPGYAALLPVAGTVMVIAARDGIANRMLSIRPIAFVGLVSYSWYLWHWPLLSFARICSATSVPTPTLVAIALVAFGISVVSWRYIEQPFRTSSTAVPLLLMRYAASAAAVAIPAVFFAVSPAAAVTHRQSLTPLDAIGDSLRSDVCVATYGSRAPSLGPPCVPNDSGPAVALIGDSHAAALASEVRQIARQDGYRLMELTKSSCPPLGGVARNVVGHPLHEEQCSAFNRDVLGYITRNPSIRVVVMMAFWSAPFENEALGERYVLDGEEAGSVSPSQSRAHLRTGLNREIGALESAGKAVYLVQDSPSFDFDPVNELETQLIGPRRVVAHLVSGSSQIGATGIAAPRSDGATRDASQIVAEVGSATPEVHLIDPEQTLCSRFGCRFAVSEGSLYVDEQHLSPLGARLALSNLKLPLYTLSPEGE